VVIVTLLLTCVTPRFVVQASDRRLTRLDGSVAEDIANKATMLCRFATFAYTGLAQCSRTERTDMLLLRCLSAEGVPITGLLDGLARDASRGIRELPLRVRRDQRRSVRRTSFVGAGFVGMKNPARFGRQPAPDELHPFVVVVSNAQDLTEQWRPEADQQFTVHVGYLGEDQQFQLHAAGQPFAGPDRVRLERDIGRYLAHAQHPEPVARLLTRAIRVVAGRNQRVGPNVMCTMVRRDQVQTDTQTFVGGLIPLIPQLHAEAEFFRRSRDGEPAQWIFSPVDPADMVHYGPNYACDGVQTAGILFGPSTALAQRR
jgi:hypothetical protein